MTPEEHADSRQHCLTASRAKRLLSENFKTWNTLAKELRGPQRVLGQAPPSIPSLHWGVTHEPWLRSEVWEKCPGWEIEPVGFQRYRPRHLVNRGTSSMCATETNLPLRPTEQTWATQLPGLPRCVYEELAGPPSADFGAETERQLSELRRRLQAPGETPAAAVRAVFGPEFADAPSGLRQAFERGLAVPDVSPGAASATDRLLMRHCGASPDGIILPGGWGYEGKCPYDPEIHNGYLTNGVLPKEYVPQVQWSLWVTGWPRWVFASGDPRRNDGGRLFVIEVEPDAALHQRFEELATRFLETYLTGEDFKPLAATAASFEEMFR